MHSDLINKGLSFQDVSQYFPSFQTCGRALFKRKAKKKLKQTEQLISCIGNHNKDIDQQRCEIDGSVHNNLKT
jgi:hypothetical protein